MNSIGRRSFCCWAEYVRSISTMSLKKRDVRTPSRGYTYDNITYRAPFLNNVWATLHNVLPLIGACTPRRNGLPSDSLVAVISAILVPVRIWSLVPVRIWSMVPVVKRWFEISSQVEWCFPVICWELPICRTDVNISEEAKALSNLSYIYYFPKLEFWYQQYTTYTWTVIRQKKMHKSFFLCGLQSHQTLTENIFRGNVLYFKKHSLKRQ
jgi:hypothetical protein